MGGLRLYQYNTILNAVHYKHLFGAHHPTFIAVHTSITVRGLMGVWEV